MLQLIKNRFAVQLTSDVRVLAIFVGWFTAVVVLGSAMAVLHSATIPAPVLSGETAGAWRALHVLGENCACSDYVADQLSARGSLAGWREEVVVIGEISTANDFLKAGGFSVTHLTAAQADRAGFQGAPWLVLRDPAGRVVYSGGYSAARPGPGRNLEDTAIMKAVHLGSKVKSLPAFGCATSARLRERLDPLHLNN